MKQTLTSLVVAAAFALIWTRYGIEPFIIPTGSMAPTLLGAHVKVHNTETGRTWRVGPQQWGETPFGESTGIATPTQHGTFTDTTTGQPVSIAATPLQAGDRIMVQKYIYALRAPRRWEVAVFLNPEDVSQHFIKRLVGMPNESLWIADGDIFTRAAGTDGPYSIERKPDRVQQSLWRSIFDATYQPANGSDAKPFVGPWRTTDVWHYEDCTYATSESDTSILHWDDKNWPLQDHEAYNETANGRSFLSSYPVSDVRVRGVLQPGPSWRAARVVLTTRGHDFIGEIDANGNVSVRMRPENTAIWTTLAHSTWNLPAPGRTCSFAVCHVDQTVQIWINGTKIVEGQYEWGGRERLDFALRAKAKGWTGWAPPTIVRAPHVRLETDGPAAFRRLSLDRDLHYRLDSQGRGLLRNGTAALGSAEFLALGDNSAASRDSRLWNNVDPWVSRQKPVRPGVVPASLLVGRAFLVYFPAPEQTPRGFLVPSFGRIRWID